MSAFLGLNEEQAAAVTQTEGPVLVSAGAGSGKTRVLTERIAYLIGEKGVPPWNILAITFTNKAAGEMRHRLGRMLGEECGVWASTFHSFAAKILRIEGENIGYDANFTIYDEGDSERVIKRLMDANGIEEKKQRSATLFHIKNAKTFGNTPEEFFADARDVVDGAGKIFTVFKAYNDELKNANAMDFDDLLLVLVRLFDERPDVLAKYQDKFRYILVDEFQDTNKVQYRLVKQLSGKSRNIFVVGDEDQSIYSWRGAQIENILNFQKDFPDAKILKLESNYRSSGNILRAANAVIVNNRSRYGKVLRTTKESGEKVEIYTASTDREEADYVIRKIFALKRAGMEHRDMAVLIRANSMSRTFEEHFNTHGISYKVFGGFKFFERREIKDLLSYLRLAVNPRDNESILRVINVPKRGIGESTVNRMKEFLPEASSIFALLHELDKTDFSQGVKSKLRGFLALCEDIIKAKSENDAPEFVKYVIERSGLAAYEHGDNEDKLRYENIQEFLNSVYLYKEDNPDGTIEEYLQSVALISDSDDATDGDYVTIATVHAVKGMEFCAVFVAGLEEGIFPTGRAIGDGDVEEERRLMYVAVTRAKDRLFLTHAVSRFRFGKNEYNLKSRFLTEMGASDGGYSYEGQNNRYGVPYAGSPQKSIYKDYDVGAETEDNSYGNSGTGVTGKDNSSARGGSSQAGAQKAQVEDYSKFRMGAEVYHDKFGKGVIAAVSGEGDSTCLTIAFQGLGIKRFFLSIAINHLKVK